MASDKVITVRSYPERLLGWIPLPYWLGIVIIWEVIFAIDYLLGSATPGGSEYRLAFGCLVLFFALVCCTVIYCSKVLVDLYEDIRLFIDQDGTQFTPWYQKQLQISYEGLMPIAFGLAVALLERFTIGEIVDQFTPAGTGLSFLRKAYQFVGFFFLGTGIWALINVVRIPIQLTRYNIRVSLTQVQGRGLQALGSSFFRMSICIIFTFIPLVAAVIVSPLSDNTFILAWLAGGVLLVFGFFLFPQVGVHRIMASEKRQRLLSFTHHLEDAMERSLKEPTSENMQRLRELFELQAHLKGMNEWPFNTNILWQLITALLIPIALAILDKVF